MIAVDTSVIVAAMSPWHEFHDAARAVCVEDTRVPAHCLFEAYSTLTRMPEPLRISGTVADEIITRQWGGKRIDPSPALFASAIGSLAKQGTVGGSTYDGLVALTVLEHGMSLVSLDRRAERTYRRLGVAYRVL